MTEKKNYLKLIKYEGNVLIRLSKNLYNYCREIGVNRIVHLNTKQRRNIVLIQEGSAFLVG